MCLSPLVFIIRWPFNLIMVTHASDTVGFPALLNEMLRKTHYTFRPEYATYARGYGVGLVDYVATLHLEARMVVGSETYNFQTRGTSPEMAIQEVAREAMTRLRHEHWELWGRSPSPTSR